MNKEYRFNHLGGVWYNNTLEDLLNKYDEKKEKNEDYYDIIKEYLEIEEEYNEFKKWVKKEVKRRDKIAIQEYIKECIY